MKHILLFSVLTLIFSNFSLAGETSTECPQMKETNERSNPKGNLGKLKIVTKIKSTSKQ